MKEKTLLLGNEAVARGLYEAGCKFVSSYPGTPSTEITEKAALYDEIFTEWAPNEKVACEAAFGACVAGARSFCAMKHVGLNVAADPLFTSSYTGVNAGFVIAVADDPSMHSSQNEQDSRHYALAAKLPMLEPSDSDECLNFVKRAYEISEKFDTPVLLRLSTRIAHSQSLTVLSERHNDTLREYSKNDEKFVMKPANAVKRHPVVEKRLELLREYAASCDLNKIIDNGSDTGIITAGTCFNYALEVFGDSVSYLKLGVINPISEKLIKDFSEKFEKIIVIEELDGFIESFCKSIGVNCEGKSYTGYIGELSQERVAEVFLGRKPDCTALDEQLPVRPPIMCPGCPHRGTFYVLKKLGISVMGDIGCYTLGSAPPLGAVDTVLCMGASVSMLHGFNSVRPDETHSRVAVIGDSTFVHSGITSLIDIVYNKSISTVLILDNNITGMTGHQQNPCIGLTIKEQPTKALSLEKVCEACGIDRVFVVDPNNMDELEALLKRELDEDQPSVIIVRRPCALLKCVSKTTVNVVDTDKCRSCRSCMRIGCPALHMENKKAVIDPTLCIGCRLCEQMCTFGAIINKDKREVIQK